MGTDTKRKTTVSSGNGYQSSKSTERYTPDTAPINYQNMDTVNKNIQPDSPPYIVLEEDKPAKELNIEKSFLDSFSRVYISGQYPIKGHTNLRIRQIIALLIQNTGTYHIVVNPALRDTIIDIIEWGKDSILGRPVSRHERKAIVTLFKHDNIK
jgi:hypothetical protein